MTLTHPTIRTLIMSLLLCIGGGVLGVTTIQAAGYGESSVATSGGEITLTGTFTSTELGTLWLGATGSTRGLIFDTSNQTFTGSMYSSLIGIIYVNSGSSNGIKVDGDIMTSSTDLSLIGKNGNPISFYSPAVGILTGSTTAKVEASTRKILSSAPLRLSNSPGLGGDIATISGVTLVPTAHNIINGDLGTGVYIASGSISIEVDSADAPYQITLRDIADSSRTHTATSFSNIITITDSLVERSGEYSYELKDSNGNISRGKILIVAANIANMDLQEPPNKDNKYARNDTANNYILSFTPKDTYGNIITDGPYLTLSGTRTLQGGYSEKSLPGWYQSSTPSSIDWSLQSLVSNNTYLSGSNPSVSVVNLVLPDTENGAIAFEMSSKSPNGNTQIVLDLETKKTDGTPISTLSQASSTYTFKPLIEISSLTLNPSMSVRQAESVMRPSYTKTGTITDAKITYVITSSGSSDEMRIRQVGVPDCSDLNQSSSTTCGWINASGVTTLSSTIRHTLSTQSGSHEIGVTFSGGTSTNTGYLAAIAEYTIGGSSIVTLLGERTFGIGDTPPTGPKVVILGSYGSSQLGQSLTGGIDLLSSDLFIRERDKIRKQANSMRSQMQISASPNKIPAGNMTSSRILIVEGDIEINSDIWSWDIATSMPTHPPKVIIALKRADGTGGNIYIKDNVKNIAASLIADGSIFGWDGANMSQNSTRQLYIYGTVISNNTIGGTDTGVCPRFLNLANCGTTESEKYDLENIRAYDHTVAGTKADDITSSASLIIQADPRLSGSSPLLILQAK